MELSKRLNAVAAMVTPGNVVCDVGCDHGYVSIFLAETGKSPKIYAMDVNKGPLERAAEHVKEAGLQDYIELILSDGLINMPEGKADTLICAGMGGKLVIKILSESIEKVKKLKELVLQPQSEIWLVREYLRTQGFVIVHEDMVVEDGKYYPILHVRVSKDGCGETEFIHDDKESTCCDKESTCADGERAVFDKYGEILLKQKHPVLKEYLLREKGLLEQIEAELEKSGGKSEKTKERFQSLSEEKEKLASALAYFKQ